VCLETTLSNELKRIRRGAPTSTLAMTKRGFARLAVLLLITTSGFAHAVLVEAKPPANGLVAGPNINVELRFNSRIDLARSWLTLDLPDQTLRPLSLQPSSSPATLEARITGLGAGEYKLRWQVLAADGHITRGEISFQVR
jgi:methionine-rich copper-binding protein CopC